MITQPTAPLLEIRDSILTALTVQQARRKGYYTRKCALYCAELVMEQT